jgi:hypothetical protein
VLASILVLVTIAGCGSGAPRPAESAPESEPGHWLPLRFELEPLWEQDPVAFMREVDAHPDAVERLALVDATVMAHSKEVLSQGLCRHLGDPGTRQRCDQWASRPHLGERERASGPGSTASHAASNACLVGCPRGMPSLSCAVHLAQQPGAITDEGSPCDCLGGGSATSECVFQAAEALLEREGLGAFERSYELCMRSEDYAGECRAHILEIAGTRSFQGQEEDAVVWSQLVELDGVLSILDSGNRASASHLSMREELWTAAFRSVRDHRCSLDPRWLMSLPASAKPHLHAGVAWWAVAQHPDPARSLEDWVALAERRMLAEERDVGCQPELLQVTDSQPFAALGLRRKGSGLCRGELPPDLERAPRCVAYHRQGFRPVVDDLRTDLTICVIEAGARLLADPQPLLREGAAHADPVVRWRARGLLVALGLEPQ